jgi:tetratricopeptide (TPR) repeat protein
MDENDETIRRCLEALDIMSKDHPERVKLLNAVAFLLYIRYSKSKTMTNLQEAVRLAQEVLDVTPEGHPNKQIWLNNLGNLLCDKYSSTEDIVDLDSAISVGRQTVDVTPVTHEDRAMLLNNFGALLNSRYLRTESIADNEEALRVSQEAVRITPGNHPERGGRLNNLRVQLYHRYSRTKDFSTLEEAVVAAQNCVQATPEDHPDRGGRLKSLGFLFDSRYSVTGVTTDLEEGVRVAQDCINKTPEDHPDRGERLNFLGAQLAKRYLRTGAMGDLDTAIRITQEAISKTSGSVDQLQRAGWLNNLAVCLGNRYSMTGAVDDLEKAIQAARDAVAKTPESSETHSNITSCLNNLGYLLQGRYSRLQQSDDINEAITLLRRAIALIPVDNKIHTADLNNNLGLALGQRFLGTESETDINEAIDSVQAAVYITSKRHPNWAKRLHNLAGLYGKRYSSTKSIVDLDTSISMAQKAVDATPEDVSDRGTYLHSLGIALGTRFLNTNSQADLEGATSCYRFALFDPSLSVMSRIRAGKALLGCYAFMEDWGQAYDTSNVVLDLIPKLTPRSLMNSDKQHLLSQITGLASDAAAVALHHGKSPLAALKFLEQGRGVLLGSLEDLQSDTIDLQKKHEQFAEQFMRLRDELDPHPLRDTTPTQDIFQPWQAQATRRYDAANEFDELITKIRQQPGFEDFLLAPSDENIHSAAKCGPIVIINVSTYRCDAIIVGHDQTRSLALPNLDCQKIEEVACESDLGHPDVLEWLWDVTVKPVLDALGFCQPPSSDAFPHLWWIPTGLLTKFPLHAAGQFRNNIGDNTLDRVMSSYNLSIKAILRGRQHRIEVPVPSAFSQALLISMPETPGSFNRLPFAAKEVLMLHGVCKSMDIDSIEPKPYKQEVVALMPSCQIFHFAGHGSTSRTDPSRSQLLLKDWQSDPLTVSTLMEMNLREKSPFLAYLSACGTGQIKDNRFVDESIHLISAFQLAGFRHVVGTLWGVIDELCVDMARLTYEGMRDKSMTDESVCWGLHTATRKMRNKWVSKRAERREASKLVKLSLVKGDIRRSDLGRDMDIDNLDDEEPLPWVPYVHFGV